MRTQVKHETPNETSNETVGWWASLNRAPLSDFEKAIYSLHGLHASLSARHVVRETFAGERVWQGEVLEFSSPQGSCYAWEVDGKITTVLKESPIDTPIDAVRASIAAQNE